MLDLRDPQNINGSERHWIPRFDYTPKKSELNKIFIYTLIACWKGELYQKLICEIGNISERNVRVIVKKLKDEGKIRVVKQGYNVHGIHQPNIYQTNEPWECNFNFDLFKGLEDSKAIGLYMWMRGYIAEDKAKENKFGNYFYSMDYPQYTYFKDIIQKLGVFGLIDACPDDDGKVKILFLKERRYPHLEDEE